MFLHSLKYAFLSLVRTKMFIFWNVIFPLLLTTFMFFALSNINNATEGFKSVKVAVVWQYADETYKKMFESVDQNSQDSLLFVQNVDGDTANKLLKEEKVEAIITVSNKLNLKIAKNGLNQTMIKMLLGQFEKNKKLIEDVGKNNPQNLDKAIKALSSKKEFVKDMQSDETNQDNIMSYFYAIFALVCMFSSFSGLAMVKNSVGFGSYIGQRKCICPNSGVISFFSDFIAAEALQFCSATLCYLVMRFIFEIDLGNYAHLTLLLLFVGTSFGTVLGMLTGYIRGAKYTVKVNILTFLSLLFCCMSDLMIGGVKEIIEKFVPIVNKINPCALITDSFLALNLFDTNDRFYINIVILSVYTLILFIVCFIMGRRKQYAYL